MDMALQGLSFGSGPNYPSAPGCTPWESRVPSGELCSRQRQSGAGGRVPVADHVQRLAGDDLAALDQLHQELVVGQLGGDLAGADDLRLGDPVGVRAARGPLAAADRGLAPDDFFATGTSGAFGSSDSARATSL